MKTTIIRHMRGIWVALVLVLIAGAVGTGTAGAATADEAASSTTATTSALTKKQKKARKKALKRCKKQRKAKKRKACIKKVKKKYKRLAKKRTRPSPKGKTYEVDVKDDYYAPSLVNLKVNDSIKWDWKFSTSREGHNVSLMNGPAGVSPFDFESPIMSGPNGTFKRQFKKPGNYNLFCTLHAGMTMDVQVSK